MENAAQNFKDLKKLGVKVIDFTGGEPLLHQHIDLLLSLAKESGFITTITTNTLLYPKLAERLRGKVDMLHFSLDSPIASEHDQSRGVKSFSFFMESIRIAKELGERPDILFTVFEYNVKHIRSVYEEICLPNRLMLLLNPVFNYNSVETGETLSESTLVQLEDWGKKKFVFVNKAFISLRREGGNNIEAPVCKAGSSTIVISPENKLILPCYHLGLKEFEIDGNLYDLYKSEEVQKLIALEGRLEACAGCEINCYMQPSFTVEMNRYWWQSLPSTLKYNRIKGTWKHLLPF